MLEPVFTNFRAYIFLMHLRMTHARPDKFQSSLERLLLLWTSPGDILSEETLQKWTNFSDFREESL